MVAELTVSADVTVAGVQLFRTRRKPSAVASDDRNNGVGGRDVPEDGSIAEVVPPELLFSSVYQCS